MTHLQIAGAGTGICPDRIDPTGNKVARLLKPFLYHGLCVILTGLCCLSAVTSCGFEQPALPKTLALLGAGKPTMIACLGDSVTGIYYHTGGQRAYPEMLAILLGRQFSQAQVRIINAGVSGTTTTDGLARLQRDVLVNHPDLVTIMFGLNDMGALSREQFQDNLNRLVGECQKAGAEVLLCTPNGIEDTEGRPVAKFVSYLEVVHAVGKEREIPVADVYQAFDDIHRRDATEFSLFMSDPIHPNMDGHKLTASVIGQVVTGRSVSVADELPLNLAFSHTRSVVAAGKPVRLLAMPPFDGLVPAAAKAIVPNAKFEVAVWSVKGKSLAEIVADAERVRDSHSDLVVVAVPWFATTNSTTEFARLYGSLINRCLSFGKKEWDVLVIPPSFVRTATSDREQQQDQLVQRLIRAQDLPLITSPNNDGTMAEALDEWLKEQLSK
jgi:lysophospholipase L1-like esterase